MYRVKLTCEDIDSAVILFNGKVRAKELLETLGQYLPDSNKTIWVIEADKKLIGCIRSHKVVVHRNNILESTQLLKVQAMRYENGATEAVKKILHRQQQV